MGSNTICQFRFDCFIKAAIKYEQILLMVQTQQFPYLVGFFGDGARCAPGKVAVKQKQLCKMLYWDMSLPFANSLDLSLVKGSCLFDACEAGPARVLSWKRAVNKDISKKEKVFILDSTKPKELGV